MSIPVEAICVLLYHCCLRNDFSQLSIGLLD